MKFWNKLFIFFIVILSSLGTFKIFKSVNAFNTKNSNNKIINDYATKLKRCFDLDNKNIRRIYESLELIQYCMNEFGID